ncbi:MAG TPA: hypothetical protein PK031_04830 [Pseudomonadales bacterium]|nr:hypothetical protein [Pseudomonadales bacterium]
MKKRVVFWLVMLALPIGLAMVVLPPAWRAVEAVLRPEVIAWIATHLSDEERQAIRAQVSNVGAGMFQQIPDASVGRVARSDWRTVYKEAEVLTNNAGMRSKTPYLPKQEGVFRIICLGDSFVFGAAGKEEDRFCDQMQAFYTEKNVRVNGKRIETLALGLPSWNTVQEADYLSARLDEYAPDVVILLTVQNDITDSAGVTENGELTTEYSTDHRVNGSAVFSNMAGVPFGVSTFTALSSDLCHTCRDYWQAAFEHVRRLVLLQHERQGQVLLSVLDHPGKHKALFIERFKQYAQTSGAPYTVAQYWHGPKTRLPHDGHPNRLGHYLLTLFYIHSLSELGWVPVPADALPTEEDMQAVNLNPALDPVATAAAEGAFIKEHLATEINFSQLDADRIGGMLGGFFPEHQGQIAEDEAPWASVRAGFLLRKPEPADAAVLQLTLALPLRQPLYPLPLTVSVNGQVLMTQSYEYNAAGTTVSLSVPVPANVMAGYPVVEVLLETPRQVSSLEDHRMKSYQLLSAAIR